MQKANDTDRTRRQYEPPTIMRVHVDPVNELLMATGVCFELGNLGCTNTNCG